tara:strand:- start:995 stop:1282 length:288 start_codon:yes stop_codon:yes gene_type:complete
MNYSMTQTALARAIKLVGKRRFQRIFNVYSELDSPDDCNLWHKYERSIQDCWEMTHFDERLQNNGFYRNSPSAVLHFMAHFIELMDAAKKHNLIK